MFVRNEIVKMDWDVEGYIETKKGGFIAAIHEYESTKGGKVAVMFMNKRAFIVYDNDEERAATLDEIKVALKECYDNGIEFDAEMEEQDALIVMTDLCEKNETGAEIYGLTEEDLDDMENRIFDLSGYEEEVSVDM